MTLFPTLPAHFQPYKLKKPQMGLNKHGKTTIQHQIKLICFPKTFFSVEDVHLTVI